jgi:hypothetical protein
LEHILSQSHQDLALWVRTDDKGKPIMGYGLQGALATVGTKPLAMFLPEGDPGKIEGGDDFGRGFLSDAMRQRAFAWLQQQAIAQFAKEARR